MPLDVRLFFGSSVHRSIGSMLQLPVIMCEVQELMPAPVQKPLWPSTILVKLRVRHVFLYSEQIIQENI